MDDSPDLFHSSFQDDGDDGNGLFGDPSMKTRSDNPNDPFSADLDGSSIDAPHTQTHLSDPFLMDSIRVQVSKRSTHSRGRNQSIASHFNSVKLEPPELTSGSSETPGTRSSQNTTTPEYTNSEDRLYEALGAEDFARPNQPRIKRRKQRKEQEREDIELDPEASRRDKFLERNRVAATKCRQKKKEWVSDLEETRFGLESQNKDLHMEYSNLRDEITHIKSQLMDHATCNDPNIDKWIENEAKRFVLGASERYDHMLANLGRAPGLIPRQGSVSSASGYPTLADSDLISPVTSSNRDSISFHPGTLMPHSPVFYHSDLTASISEAVASAPAETSYPANPMGDATGFDGVSIANVLL
ncbi:hypothetical protein F4677DRAFT_142811 [Hypoxylon crocopeplum]|nr:hypothetical protein F4677DRAFT_142811 [Hypoxylon crocopeplum]